MKEILLEIQDISFIDYQELYENRKEIKKLYLLKDIDVKKIYKWYFYCQLCMLKPYYKDSIWQWLNNSYEENEVIKRYEQFSKLRCNLTKRINK